jgi:hypothetical protein
MARLHFRFVTSGSKGSYFPCRTDRPAMTAYILTSAPPQLSTALYAGSFFSPIISTCLQPTLVSPRSPPPADRLRMHAPVADLNGAGPM